MTEFDFLCRILNDRFLCTGNERFRLRENSRGIDARGRKQLPQEIRINVDNSLRANLYRFDFDTSGDFLPFFRLKNDENYPSKLRKFCDYILLVEENKYLYIFLIEIKTKHSGEMRKQLDAAAIFVDYIINTAERIKSDNEQKFSSENVEIRRLLLKEDVTAKFLTKGVKNHPIMRNKRDNLLLLQFSNGSSFHLTHALSPMETYPET